MTSAISSRSSVRVARPATVFAGPVNRADSDMNPLAITGPEGPPGDHVCTLRGLVTPQTGQQGAELRVQKWFSQLRLGAGRQADPSHGTCFTGRSVFNDGRPVQAAVGSNAVWADVSVAGSPPVIEQFPAGRPVTPSPVSSMWIAAGGCRSHDGCRKNPATSSGRCRRRASSVAGGRFRSVAVHLARG